MDGLIRLLNDLYLDLLQAKFELAKANQEIKQLKEKGLEESVSRT